MSLSQMISSQASIQEIAAYLDSLSSADRLAETRTLNRAKQRYLYEIAADSEDLNLDYFVPTREPKVEVIHYGTNTLPVPSAIRFFEKRFCRPEKHEDRLFGFNEGVTRKLLGPGYFVAKYCTEGWKERGSIVIDYFEVPDGDVVPTWPPVKRNNQGLQVLVYHQTRDFMRRVSQHVSIGAAYKKEKALGHFFVLCRNE